MSFLSVPTPDSFRPGRSPAAAPKVPTAPRPRRACSIALLFALGISALVLPRLAHAAPRAPAQSYYIAGDWADAIPFHGMSVPRAYQYGYETPPGDGPIILHFWRQYRDARGDWGVKILNRGFEPNSWVRSVAQAFLDGYRDGHPHHGSEIGRWVSPTGGRAKAPGVNPAPGRVLAHRPHVHVPTPSAVTNSSGRVGATRTLSPPFSTRSTPWPRLRPVRTSACPTGSTRKVPTL